MTEWLSTHNLYVIKGCHFAIPLRNKKRNKNKAERTDELESLMGTEHLHSLRVTLVIIIHQGPIIREIKNQETYAKSSYTFHYPLF